MTIAAAAFDNVHGTGVSTLDTSSKTWVLNNLYIVSVYNFLAAGPTTPTISGLTQQGSSEAGTTLNRQTVFSFLGDGATNAKTIDFGGTSQSFIEAIVDEVTGTVITGTNGTDAFVQVVGDSSGGTTAAVTLAAFASASNATWFASGNNGGSANTPKAGFTGLSISNGAMYLSSEYLASSDTAPNMTLSSANWTAFGIELAEAGSPPPPSTVLNLHTSRRGFRRAMRRGMH